MEIRTTSLLFPETSGSGPATAQAELTFPRDVVRVELRCTQSFVDDRFALPCGEIPRVTGAWVEASTWAADHWYCLTSEDEGHDGKTQGQASYRVRHYIRNTPNRVS